MNYEILSIETTKKLESAEKIINELSKIIEQYSKNEYYYKYDGKYLKNEIINDLKELKEKYGWK